MTGIIRYKQNAFPSLQSQRPLNGMQFTLSSSWYELSAEDGRGKNYTGEKWALVTWHTLASTPSLTLIAGYERVMSKTCMLMSREDWCQMHMPSKRDEMQSEEQKVKPNEQKNKHRRMVSNGAICIQWCYAEVWKTLSCQGRTGDKILSNQD